MVALLAEWDRAEPRVRRLEEKHPWPRALEVEIAIYERVVAEMGLEAAAAKGEARFARVADRRRDMASSGK